MKLRKFCFWLVILIVAIKLFLTKDDISEAFLEIDKCPTCYGTTACNNLNKWEGYLHSFTQYKIFNALLNVKNVFFFKSGTTEYVLKKLAHSSELTLLERKLESMIDVTNVHVSKTLQYLWNSSEKSVEKFISTFPTLFEHTEVLKCGHPKMMKFLHQRFMDFDKSDNADLYFLMLLAVNPEPLIIEAFKYPYLPKLIGTCGRIIIEEYGGLSLTRFYHKPWRERARIASNLLQIAVNMSENSPRMYLTDSSPDNFAVDEEGNVKLIDAENIVLVDPNIDGLDKTEHYNDGRGCFHCFSYSYDEICSHSHADHNYFAICKGLLSEKPFTDHFPSGFLHDIPQDILSHIPDLPILLEECSLPKKKRRSEAAKRLIDILDIFP